MFNRLTLKACAAGGTVLATLVATAHSAFAGGFSRR